jgi:cellulose biosynthesis protein BcsQ
LQKFEFLNWDHVISQLIFKLDGQVKALSALCGDQKIVIVRDWQGKLSLYLPCAREDLCRSGLTEWLGDLGQSLGLLASSSDVTLCHDELFDPDDIWNDPNLVGLESDGGLQLFLLDRQDKEGDWLRALPPQSSTSATPRAIFFGVKGGVGRSSALAALALHLAKSGKNILIVDADFESPGVSSSLLSNVQPDYGLVDWLTAHALGCPDAELRVLAATKLVETSPLNQLTNGKILVAPAHAKLTQAYVAKLGRIYRPTPDGQTFAQRLNLLITALEGEHQIDVTLIDSRAGIDDTAAAAMTQLNARVSFLFAMNTSQTWDAYSLLFKHLKHHPSLRTTQDFRPTLRMISAMTPEEVGSTVGYRDEFQQSAYDVCFELYDSVTYENESLLFAPSFEDGDAPHSVMRIMWDEVLRSFDPIKEPGQLEPAVIAKVFSDFLQKASRLLV